MWHLRSLLETNFCCHGPAWGYNSTTKVVSPGVGLPRDQWVCPALPGSPGWGAEQGIWSVVSPSPRSPLPCHATAAQLPVQEER